MVEICKNTRNKILNIWTNIRIDNVFYPPASVVSYQMSIHNFLSISAETEINTTVYSPKLRIVRYKYCFISIEPSPIMKTIGT